MGLREQDASGGSHRQLWVTLVSGVAVTLVLAACGTAPSAARSVTGKPPAQSVPVSSTPRSPTAGSPGSRVAVRDVYDVSFVRPSSGWGLAAERGSNRDVVVRSTDGGRRWRTWSAPLPPVGSHSYVSATSLVVLLAGNGVGSNVVDAVVSATGSRSVLVSSDRLRSWHRVSLPAPVLAVAAAPGPRQPGTATSLAVGVANQPLWTLVGPLPASETAVQAGMIGLPGKLAVFQLYPALAAWKAYGTLAGPSWTGHSAVGHAQLVRLSANDGYVVVDGDVVDPASPAGYAQVTLVQRTTTDAFAWQPVPEPCGGLDLVTPLGAASLDDLWLGCAGEPGAGDQTKTVERSTDAGTSWTTVWAGADQGTGGTAGPEGVSGPATATMTPGYLEAVVATSATSAYVALGRGGLLHTTDSGKHWGVAVPHIGGSGGIQQLDVLGSADAWALVGYGELWATTDGKLWREIAGVPPPASAS